VCWYPLGFTIPLSSCHDKAIRTRLPRRRGMSPLMEPAVLSAALQIQMRTGPRSPTLLSGGGYRTALPNAITVSSSVIPLDSKKLTSMQARSSRDVLKTSRDAQDHLRLLHLKCMPRSNNHSIEQTRPASSTREARNPDSNSFLQDYCPANTRLLCTVMTM
jgi:hypothetical protein